MKQLPKYPVYVISKGRADVCHTADFLIKDGVPFRLVIEPQEWDDYARKYPAEILIKLPFSNLGLGSIPARNFVWEHAKEAGHFRHWILDDNMTGVYRYHKGKRILCRSGVAFKIIEDFTDRYENIAIAGMNYYFFVGRSGTEPPFYLNTHVYSTLLIRNDLPHRWRGRYNEDTDLCLQVLTDGWCTIGFNAFVMFKMQTMTVKGGNNLELYKGDGRLKMARSLERQWPYVVTTRRRFNRPQHVVAGNWAKFDTQLIRRKDIDWTQLEQANNYGLYAVKVADEIKSPKIQAILDETGKIADSKVKP